ncbi:Nuclear control of ATP synthase 2 [Dillenia turbinata]|uniref:Nuclear control of ATP synthase 2 n=1 Tax=Dillenia turbinata TaxID=194707 RepID=A0AAN8V9Y8_9MAGN
MAEPNDWKTSIIYSSNQLWDRLLSLFHSSHSTLLHKISNLRLQKFRIASPKRTPGLPLPLPSSSIDSFSVSTDEASRVFDVLEDILEHVFLDLHEIQKNLRFWQAKAEGSNFQKVYFLMFERGPWAFIDGTIQFLRESYMDGLRMQHLCHSASCYISERINMLTTLRNSLATFLAKVYVEVDKFGEEIVKDPVKSLPSILVTLDDLFSKLEASIGHLHAEHQIDSSVDGTYSFPLLFEKVPGINQEGSQWTDCEIRDAINMIYQNLQKLDGYLSVIVAKHRKPRSMTIHWIRYTGGLVGLSICSVWLLRHSSFMGSSDIDNWICEAKNSTLTFWNDHVEKPLVSIRDELFETFKKRQKGVMEAEEVQLTADSLHRMLLAFCEQTKGQKFPENASDQRMLEIVMARYEKELMHPIQNLLGGELVRALLIQVEKLKLDIETAMLELDQILRANEINFAILAALPAFFLSLSLLMLLRAWLKKDTRAEGRGKIARIQRRLMIVEIEKRIMQHQIYVDQGEARFKDIVDLAKPTLQTSYKLIVTSRMERVYDCLLPSVKRQ